MKDKRESDKTHPFGIKVLGATFFMVGPCPRVETAIAVFTAGMAVYSFSWCCECYENKDQE